MKSLENVVAESNNVKNSSKYLNEDSKFQDQYDQKVTEAKDLINQTTNPTLEPNKVDIIKIEYWLLRTIYLALKN